MKHVKKISPLLFALTAIVLATANSAEAMHLYAEDNCVTKLPNGKTLEISLATGKPASPHRIINEDPAAGDRWVNFNNKKDSYDVPVGESSLALMTQTKSRISRTGDSDGCFEGYSGLYTQTAAVASFDPKLKQLGYEFKRGMVLHFVCYESYSAPTGKHCL